MTNEVVAIKPDPESNVEDVINALPHTIDLGYRKYKVMCISQDDLDFLLKKNGALGAHHGYKTQILITDTDHYNGAEVVNTVLHEIAHAAMALYGPGKVSMENEEDCVKAVANGMTELFRRNPCMLDWIKDSLEV